MSLVSAHVSFTLRYFWLQQKCENIYKYFAEGEALAAVNAVQLAEAWWNDVKAVHRALMPDFTVDGLFQSVICRNLVTDGELGEYAIPVDETVGTRSTTGLGQPVSGIMAGGIRFTVGNTSTRPGQKRYPMLFEADIEGNALVGTYVSLLETLGAHMESAITLGSPAVGGVVQPVVGGTVVAGYPTVYQDVLGHVVNQFVTSQVSRKLGHGS